MTFAVDAIDSHGASVCNIQVSYLNSTASNSDATQVIFGGMFFEEFYGQFTNTYSNTSTMIQSAQLFVGVNSIFPSYIGDEQLPIGPDPFPQPVTPPTSTSNAWAWILVGCLVGAIALGVLGSYCYRQHQASKNASANKRNYNSSVSSYKSDDLEYALNKTEISTTKSTPDDDD